MTPSLGDLMESESRNHSTLGDMTPSLENPMGGVDSTAV